MRECLIFLGYALGVVGGVCLIGFGITEFATAWWPT